MLETIREYGLERLTAAGEEAAARDRHATWCLALAEQAEPELTGPDQQRWFARLDAEHDNLRSALGWAIEEGNAETAQRLGGALYRFWATGGHFEEARRWLDLALTREAHGSPAARAKALLGAEVIAFFQGEYQRAAAHGEEALALYQALGDTRGVASSYGNLGLLADARGDYAQATARYEEALTIFRALDDQSHVNFMLGNLGLIAFFQGDYERATALLEEAVALGRTLGDRNSVAIALGNLGLVAYARGDYERATTLQREALALRRVLGNKANLARLIENVALIAAARRAPVRAARLFGAAEALRARIGAPLQPNDRDFNDAAHRRGAGRARRGRLRRDLGGGRGDVARRGDRRRARSGNGAIGPFGNSGSEGRRPTPNASPPAAPPARRPRPAGPRPRVGSGRRWGRRRGG